MELPFAIDQFLQVFADYNRSVFPMQFVFYALAAGAVILAVRKSRLRHLTITSILSFLWIWMGIVYHLIFFSTINKAAVVFGILYIIQGGLLIVYQRHLAFGFKNDFRGWTGAVFILYALVIYPLLGMKAGHVYPFSPTFGLPCPTTIFTFGMLMWAEKRVPPAVLLIPFLWSLIGFTAALSLGILEDIGLLIAGVGGTLIILTSQRPQRKAIQG